MGAAAELRELRAELRAHGAFEHCEVRSWLKLGVLFAGIAGCLVSMIVISRWCAVFAVPIAAVLCTSAAMLGHEGSHRSFSASPTRNNVLTYLVFPLFSGLSSLYWRGQT
jgi:fatty acid desaturase